MPDPAPAADPAPESDIVEEKPVETVKTKKGFAEKVLDAVTGGAPKRPAAGEK